MLMSVKIRTVAAYFTAVLALQFLFPDGEGWTAPEKLYVQEVSRLAALEKDYFQRKIGNDLEGVYAYQHSEFKKHISIEEFQFYSGRVVYNYRDGAEHHVSGGLTPTVAFIKNNPEQRDALGFPRQTKFRWFDNPFISVQSYDLKRIMISEDGKYAKVAVELKGREKINPALVRGDIGHEIKKPFIDYWEKVGGEWKIALLTGASSISGGSKEQYFIPNSAAAWEKMKFISYVTGASAKSRKK